MIIDMKKKQKNNHIDEKVKTLIGASVFIILITLVKKKKKKIEVKL